MFKPSGHSDKEIILSFLKAAGLFFFVIFSVLGTVMCPWILWIWGGWGIFLLGWGIYRKLVLRSGYEKKVKKEEAEKALNAAYEEYQKYYIAYLAYQKAYADYLESQKTLPESASQTREQ